MGASLCHHAKGLGSLLVASAVARVAGNATSSRSSCIIEFEARLKEFLDFSGAPTTALVSNLVGQEPPDERVLQYFERVEMQAGFCWRTMGGRYWDVMVESTRYMESFMIAGTWCHKCKEEFEFRWKSTPHQIFGGVCAPASCDEQQVVDRIIPRFIAHILMFDVTLPPPLPGDASAKELSHWSQLQLDFAIAGVNNCGTTSLLYNLGTHPGIAFSGSALKLAEDDFFFRHNRLLPYRDEVETFNFQWLSHGSDRDKVKGMKHPGLFHNERVRLAMSRIPRLKVYVILCDPVSRLEKIFLNYHSCAKSGSTGGRGLPLQTSGTARCFENAAAVAEEPLIRMRWEVGSKLLRLKELLGPGLRVMHQESLRKNGPHTYRSLAGQLGAGEFPNDVSFGRYNAQLGHRTNLCHNATLIIELQRLLSSEYDVFEELLLQEGSLPQELLHRLTRCDRAEDLRYDSKEESRTGTGHNT